MELSANQIYWETYMNIDDEVCFSENDSLEELLR